MRHFKAIAATALGLASLSFPSSDPTQAAVRRHLDCIVLSHIVGGIQSVNPGSTVRITNNWSLTIPKGTSYTYVVARKARSFKSSKALGPGGVLNISGPIGAPTAPCTASVPG